MIVTKMFFDEGFLIEKEIKDLTVEEYIQLKEYENSLKTEFSVNNLTSYLISESVN